MSETNLHAAFVTAPGPGALALLTLRGHQALDFVIARLSPPRVHARLQPGRLAHGTWGRPGEVIDEVLVDVIASDYVRVGFHGGAAVRAAVEADLIAAGATLGDPVALEARDAIEAAALRALGRAFAPRAVAMLCQAESGALSARIRALAERLLAGEGPCKHELEIALSDAAIGRALADPPVIVLVGAPNAGKSTLANALLEEDRVIVSDLPGTTRDLVRAPLIIDGFPFELVDAAGLRESPDPVERLGISRLLALLEGPAIAILLRRADAEGEAELAAYGSVASRCNLRVWTQVDRVPAPPARQDADPWVSARTGMGIAALRSAILALSPFARAWPLDRPLPFMPSHERALREAHALCRSAPTRAAEVLFALLREEVTP